MKNYNEQILFDLKVCDDDEGHIISAEAELGRYIFNLFYR